MTLGETRTLVIEAVDAYGEPSDQFIQEIPKDQFTEAEIEPGVGEVYNFVFGPGTVLEV
jgi:FKBP-type peptidyl-prolyl cis-trans isomerase 2